MTSFVSRSSHTRHTSTARSKPQEVMTSIYRSSPAKRSKPAGSRGGATGGGGGAGGGSAGAWTLVGEEPQQGNPDWPCPKHKSCGGYILAKTRKGSTSKYGVCDTRRTGDRTGDQASCQTFYNVNRRHWGAGENARLCDWCDCDTGDSPSIGVANKEGAASNKGET